MFLIMLYFFHIPVVKKLSLHATHSIIKLTRKNVCSVYIKTGFSNCLDLLGRYLYANFRFQIKSSKKMCKIEHTIFGTSPRPGPIHLSRLTVAFGLNSLYVCHCFAESPAYNSKKTCFSTTTPPPIITVHHKKKYAFVAQRKRPHAIKRNIWAAAK